MRYFCIKIVPLKERRMKGVIFRFFSVVLILLVFAGLTVNCDTRLNIQISDLNISPSKIIIGQKADISALVYNPNKGEEKYSVTLKVDEIPFETKELILAGGEKKTVDFSHSPPSSGTFKIDVNGLVDNLSVVNPPEFQVTSLNISSTEVTDNSTITVTAEVKNIGGIEGSYNVKLFVDGVLTTSKEISVGVESPEKVEFFASLSMPGSHSLEVGGITKTVKVLRPAELKINTLKVTPDQVYTGQKAVVKADVVNIGEAKGDLPLNLLINGVESEVKTLPLDGGQLGSISFDVSRDETGDFELRIKDRTAILKVLKTKSYTNPKFNYSISYPFNWILDETKPEEVTLENPATVFSSVYIVDLPAGVTQDGFIQSISSYNEKNLLSFKVLPGTLRKYGDSGASVFDFTYSRYGVFARGSCFVRKSGQVGYVIFCETLAVDWEENLTAIDLLLSSFKPPK
jgi:hypothetical protein